MECGVTGMVGEVEARHFFRDGGSSEMEGGVDAGCWMLDAVDDER